MLNLLYQSRLTCLDFGQRCVTSCNGHLDWKIISKQKWCFYVLNSGQLTIKKKCHCCTKTHLQWIHPSNLSSNSTTMTFQQPCLHLSPPSSDYRIKNKLAQNKVRGKCLTDVFFFFTYLNRKIKNKWKNTPVETKCELKQNYRVPNEGKSKKQISLLYSD